MIKINNLSYSKNSAEILKDINTVFNEGEIIGIIGESGSGKTTLLKIIACIIKDFSGELFFNNQSIKSIPAKDIQKHIVSLFSHSSYDIIDETVFNFLMQSRKLFKKILSPFTEFDVQITEDYIKLFNLNFYRDISVLALSEGILKKVFLAFSFIKNAEVLLLDNPTTSMDLNSVSLLQKAVLRYSIDGDKIIIIASNDLNFLFQTADRIIIMKEGRMDAEANPENINAQMINKYFNTEVLISRNIYNGKPNIHHFLKGEG